MAEEITEPLSIISQQSWLISLETVSRTLVLGKIMEQIILSAIMWHLEDNQGSGPASLCLGYLTSLIFYDKKLGEECTKKILVQQLHNQVIEQQQVHEARIYMAISQLVSYHFPKLNGGI
ncbi:hypothetical protein WISP_62691 [Willisornis vidua]|uniref:Uncharacterized protein n=1 Tax=Willisornis vidua TaxID=1566151 RepID=A0ABQ9DAL0_9PASS|nr:hypothetical protein WISP_62691 [Willisornis vidua]